MSQRWSWPLISAMPSRKANGMTTTNWPSTMRRRSKRSEIIPPTTPPSSSGDHIATPVSCTKRGDPVIWLTR